MSPVSRARKKKSKPTPPSMNGLFKDILRDFSSLGTEPEPLDVELLTSEVLGQWWRLPAVEEGDAGWIGLEMITFAGRKSTPGSAALLAAVGTLGETAQEREAAIAAWETLLGRGIPKPNWAETLGQVSVVECWQIGDVYGDESSLLCVFSRGERKHGVLTLLDFNELGGRARELVVVDKPEEVLAEMRVRLTNDGDLATMEQVSPATAHQLLADGLAATDQLDEPQVSMDYVRFRGLALARCRSLPEPQSSPMPEVLSEAARDEIVAEFLAAVEAVEDTEGTRACARLIVDFGAEVEPTNPLRVGPEKIARFLEAVLSGAVGLEEDRESFLAPVLLSWTAWSAVLAGLPESAITALIETVGEYLIELDQGNAGVEAYLDGSEERAGSDELADLLDRRMFAIPSVYTELGGEELELDPTEPQQRRLLVVGEHPEYHEAIAGETLDGTPRTQLELRANLVDQLWDNQPPEVWQAAQRLRDGGFDRAEILRMLGAVLVGQLRPDVNDEMGYDLDEYRRALQAIS